MLFAFVEVGWAEEEEVVVAVLEVVEVEIKVAHLLGNCIFTPEPDAPTPVCS